MNVVVLVGRLTKDPELRRTSNDIPVVQFTLAVNRPFSNNTEKTADFINCVVWRAQAENLAKFMHKGSQIGVKGQIQVRTYEDNSGAKRYVTEVICDNIYFLESKGSRDQSGFSDINSYDIPDYQGSQEPQINSKSSSPFDVPSNPGNNGSTRNDSKNVSSDNNSSKPSDETDPFASLRSSSGISDDNLPF